VADRAFVLSITVGTTGGVEFLELDGTKNLSDWMECTGPPADTAAGWEGGGATILTGGMSMVRERIMAISCSL